MRPRLKKLIGMALLVSFSGFYFAVAVTVAIARLPGTHIGVQLGFYAAATVIWFLAAAALIYWMQKPEASSG